MEIERSSIDFYASTRNLYRQSRNAQIQGDEPAVPESPRSLSHRSGKA